MLIIIIIIILILGKLKPNGHQVIVFNILTSQRAWTDFPVLPESKSGILEGSRFSRTRLSCPRSDV